MGKRSTPETFWRRVRQDADRCWEFMGALTAAGYGLVGYQGRLVYAHRLAYELAVGPIPDGLRILHTCDNPPCCNPAHLRAGTAADNSRDMVAKGRMAQQRDPSKIARGERHWRRKAVAA